MKNKITFPIAVVLLSAVATILATALLVNIFTRKQEAETPFFNVVQLTDDTEDPAEWGKNFPLQYDGYLRTVDQQRTRFGGSEAIPRTPTGSELPRRHGGIDVPAPLDPAAERRATPIAGRASRQHHQ